MPRDTKKMQIYDLLKERIEGGFYPPGGRLPKEVDLAGELDISRVTLRSALELLEMERLVTRVKGAGTFARDRKTGQTRLLVIVFTEDPPPVEYESNPYLYILPCIQMAAKQMNADLEICDAQSLLSSDPAQGAARIRERGIQGILLLAGYFTGREPILSTIRETGLPVLLPHAIRADAEITGFSVMGTNYEELTRDGLKYLAAQGHRRVGFIGGRSMRDLAVSDYLLWLKEFGLDTDPRLLQLIEWRRGRQIVFDAVSRLMALPEPPTAIFSYSDYLSLQIYEALHREKIRIPEDVCVLSIGGQIGCDFLNPPLSAMEFIDREIGETAVQVMLEMIRDRRRVPFIVTPHRLHVRESTRKIILHRKKAGEMRDLSIRPMITHNITFEEKEL